MNQCPSCGGMCPQIPPKSECKKQSLSNSADATGSVAKWLIGEEHLVFGKVIGAGFIEGEAYRWLQNKHGAISMMPLDVLG